MTLSEFRDYLADVAWFWPGVAVSIIIAILLSARVARALKVRPVVATALMLAFGLIISATLTPSREALRFGTIATGSCDFGRIGPPTIAELFRFGDPTFNVILFIPLGLAIGLVPAPRRRTALLVAAVALPFAIETIQLLATALDRACQSSDVSDNLTGLVIGLVGGIAVRRFVRATGGRRLEDQARGRDG